MPRKPAFRFYINATQRCFNRCKWCDRGVGLIRIPNSDVTYGQVLSALRILRKWLANRGAVLRKIKVGGGEPCLNPNIREILDLICRTRFVPRLQLMSNWPSDDLLYSHPKLTQKRSPVESKWHYPVFISPVDIGLEVNPADFPKCEKLSKCGIAFDSYGFTFCAISGTLGRLLGINPYSRAPRHEMDWNICRHCIETLGWRRAYEVGDQADRGEIKEPSPTYAAGIARYCREGEPFGLFEV